MTVKDLPPEAKCKLFADDMKSYITFINSDSYSLVPSMLDAISSWSVAWQLPISLTKCNWMFICNRKNENILFSVNLLGSCVDRIDEVKDLGILFNSKLNFSPHISQIVSEAKQRIFFTVESFSYSNIEALILAYKTYVLPVVDGRILFVWSPSLVTDIIAVESVQRLFTRRLKPCLNLNYKERFSYCGLFTLEKRRLIADLILMYKILHGLVNLHFGNALVLFTGPTHGHTYKLVTKGARINTRQHFFISRTVKPWNSLPQSAFSAESVYTDSAIA